MIMLIVRPKLSPQVTLPEGYDPIQGKDDGFNILVVIAPAE